MPVHHVFTSPQPDVADPTLVRPSNWNDSHAITLVEGVSLLGNTAGVLALVSSGTLFLAGGNNVTLSQNANSVTISAGAGAGTAFSAGVSTGGNTSGDTGTVAARLVFVGGNNVTLSQATAVGGSATITISAFNQTLQTQSRFNLTLDGNTSGALALISSGVMTLAGGNNITLSQAGNAVTISGASQTTHAHTDAFNILSAGTQIAGTQATIIFSNSNGLAFGMSNSSVITGSYTQSTHGHTDQFNIISAGTQLAGTASTIVFSDSNGIAFGMSNNSIVTASYSQSTHPHTDAYNILAAGTQTAITQGSVIFSNSNGLAFGMSNSSIITGSYSQSTHPHTDAYNIIAAGTQTAATQASVIFSNSNGVAFGMSNSSIVTASYSQSTHTHSFLSAGMSTQGNTSGTTGLVAEQLIIVGGNNVTLSQSVNGQSATLTISAGAGAGAAPTLSHWANFGGPGVSVNIASGVVSAATNNATLWVFPLNAQQIFPGNMSVSSVQLAISASSSTNWTDAQTWRYSFGIYTRANASALSLLYSASSSYTDGATSQSSLIMGFRWLTFGSADFNAAPNLSQSEYFGALWVRSSGQSRGISMIVGRAVGISNAMSGAFGAGSVAGASIGNMPWHGQYSATFTTAMPTALNRSDMLITGNNIEMNNIPLVVFNNYAGLYGY